MQIPYRYFLFSTAVSILTLSSGISITHADTLTIEVKVYSSSSNLGMQIPRASKTPVQIVISEKGWKMTHADRNFTWEYGSEGANVFHLATDHDTGARSGNVTPFMFPIHGYMYQLPWLAYCTGFIGEGDLKALPPWRRSDHPEAHTFDVNLDFNEEYPKLPKLIQWRGNEEKSKTAKNYSRFIRKRFLGKEQLNELKEWKFRMPDGFIAGVYQVDKFTRIGRWEIPESAELEVREYLGEKDGMAEWKVVANFRLELLDAKISDDEVQSFLPEITGLTWVIDSRINPESSWPAYYSIEDSWIMNTNNPVLVESYQKTQSEMSRSRMLNYFGSRIPSIIQWVVFFLILAFVFRKQQKKFVSAN